MKSLLRRFAGKLSRPSNGNHSAEPASPSSSVELEPLEPRMLFSAAPVEAPAETEDAPEPQAAQESVTTESTATASASSEPSSVTGATGSGQTETAPAPAADGETVVASGQEVALVDLGGSSSTLNQETLDAIAEAAAERWRASGLTAEQSAALDAIDYHVADLTGPALAQAEGNRITIDVDAAGSDAWFVDATPDVDEEYLGGVASGAAAGNYDLLSVILHEQGHVLGIGDLSGNGDDVMNQVLGTGDRRLPAAAQAEGAVAGSVEGDSFVVAAAAPGDQVFFETFSGTYTEITAFQGDSSGNVYVLGWSGYEPSHPSPPTPTTFFAKLDATGNQQFLKTVNGGSTFENAKPGDLHVDSSGNVYVTGSIVNREIDPLELELLEILGPSFFPGYFPTDFAGNLLPLADGIVVEAYVAKFDVDGNQLFFKTVPSTIWDDGITGVQLDSSGNVIVTGRMQGSVDFAGNAVTGNGGTDGFVAKLDATGNQLFFKTVGSAGFDSIQSLQLDSSGNVIVTGWMQGSGVDFDGTAVTGNGVSDGFVAKLDATGNQLFFKTVGSAGFDSIQSLQLDSSGNVIVTGRMQGSGVDFAGTAVTGNGSDDGFVAKLDATGNQLFFKTVGSAGFDSIQSLQLDSSGNVFVTGRMQGSGVDFDGNAVTGNGETDGFVAKLDATGNQLFFKTVGSAGFDSIQSLQLDSSGNVFVTGRMQGSGVDFDGNAVTGNGETDGFVAKLDATGNQLFFKTVGSAGSDSVYEMQLDGSGNVIVTGSMQGSGVDFAGTAVTGNGSDDGFVAKLDATGNQLFFKTVGSAGSDSIQSLQLDSSGNVIVTGRMQGSGVDFDGTAVTGNGGFIAKLSGADGVVAPPVATPNTVSVDPAGNAVITADGDKDTVSLSVSGSNLVISTLDDSISGDGGTSTNAFGDVLIPLSSLTTITLNTGDGDDTLTIGDLTGFTGSLVLDGGDGQDEITFGADVVLAADNNAAITAEEVKFVHGSIVTSGEGSITIDAAGSSGGASKGISLLGTDLVAGGTGSITLNGEGGDSGSNNQGIQLAGGSTLSTDDGDIAITGMGGGDGAANQGVAIHWGSTISAGGDGNLILSGTSSPDGTTSNHGVFVAAGAALSVEDGDLIITGTASGTGLGSGVYLGSSLSATGSGNIVITGSSTATGSGNTGISAANISISTVAGTGSITLNGTGSVNGLSLNDGVKLVNVDIATGGNGAIDIDGLGGGSGAGTTNSGVTLSGGSTVAAAGTGAVTIDGTGGSGTYFNRGVYVTGAGSSITSVNGALTVQGTGNGSVGTNRGVDFSYATVKSTGIGAVSLRGTGSTSSTGLFNTGVYLLSSTASATMGALTIDGHGGTGSSYNKGVHIQSSTVTTTGTLTMTGTANGGTTGAVNSGIYLLSATLDGGAGSLIEWTGGGGTSSNHGIYGLGLNHWGSLAGANFAGHKGSGLLSQDLSGTFPV